MNFSRSKIVGPTAGVVLTADKAYLYGGVSVGPSLYPITPALNVRNGKDVDPGLNYSISAGAVIGVQYSGKLDAHHIRSSLENGKFSFGGTLPSASLSVVYVHSGIDIPCL